MNLKVVLHVTRYVLELLRGWWRKPVTILANTPTHTKSAFCYAQGHHKSTSLQLLFEVQEHLYDSVSYT